MSWVYIQTKRHTLDKLANRLHTSNAIKLKASSIYQKAHEHGLVKGKSVNAVLAACLYLASRLKGESRTLGHFARAAGIPKRSLARRYRFLVMGLDLRMPLRDLTMCVSRLARQVNIGTSTRRVATHIVYEAKKKGKISGRNPMSIAAAALYVACLFEREKKTQREIANAADVTVVTLRNNVNSLQRGGTLAERFGRLRDGNIGDPEHQHFRDRIVSRSRSAQKIHTGSQIHHEKR